ncbi:MAG: hypothetical protein M3Y71_00965 [Actinomycetota bacterium]|nr:hypothetical protein [Actinomycetota bacterium]
MTIAVLELTSVDVSPPSRALRPTLADSVDALRSGVLGAIETDGHVLRQWTP